MVNVLGRLGVEVDVPKKQTCCGQPAYNSGYWPDARAVATRFLDIFDGEGTDRRAVGIVRRHGETSLRGAVQGTIRSNSNGTRKLGKQAF